MFDAGPEELMESAKARRFVSVQHFCELFPEWTLKKLYWQRFRYGNDCRWIVRKNRRLYVNLEQYWQWMESPERAAVPPGKSQQQGGNGHV